MKLSIVINATRGKEDPKTFAKRYWNFREHVKGLQLKGSLPAGEIKWEFAGSYKPIEGQLILPLERA